MEPNFEAAKVWAETLKNSMSWQEEANLARAYLALSAENARLRDLLQRFIGDPIILRQASVITTGARIQDMNTLAFDAGAALAAAPGEPHPRFPETSCSQCGRSFGPGDHGFSHCDQHEGKVGKP